MCSATGAPSAVPTPATAARAAGSRRAAGARAASTTPAPMASQAATTPNVPRASQLLADHGEGVVAGGRRQPVARAAVAEPDPARRAGRVGVREGQHLEPLAAAIALGGAESRGSGCRRTRSGSRRWRARRASSPAAGSRRRPATPPAGQRGERHRQGDRRGREVRLDDQRQHAPAARRRWPGGARRGVDAPAATSSATAPSRNGAGPPDRRPRWTQRLRARGAHADAGREDRQRERQRRQKNERRRGEEAPRSQARQGATEHGAAGEPDQLADGEVGGRADARGAWPRGRRRDDQQAERAEADGRHDEKTERERAAAHRSVRTGGPRRDRRRGSRPGTSSWSVPGV